MTGSTMIYRIAGRVKSITKQNHITTVTIDSTAYGQIPAKGVNGPLNNFFYQPGGLNDNEIAILEKAKQTDDGVIISFTITNGQREVISVIQTVSLTINNTSGIDLVVSFLQGGLPGQSVDQLKWLNLSGISDWEVPNNPTSNVDLYPYMQDVSNGSSITIYIPSYSEDVGFRCLLAETAYKSNALQTINNKNYMAFPNLMTAAYKFDKFEAGLTEGTPGIWNITSVDFLAFPMQLSKDTIKVGYKDGVTASGIQSLLTNLGTPYSAGGTMTPNTSSDIYRFFSPAHIPSADTCLDTQISDGLSKLQSNSCTVKYGAFVFSNFTASSNTVNGKVVGSVSCQEATNGTISIDNLTTVNAFSGEVGADSGASAAKLTLGALLAAATCRGVLENPEEWGDIVYTTTQCATPWNYYPAGKVFDKYSHIVHQYSIDNKNYGFSYDDYFADEAGFNVVTGDTVDLNVLPLTGTMTAAANPIPPVKTGCIAITIPSGATNQLGDMFCNQVPLEQVTNTQCFLDHKIIISFKNYPKSLTKPEIHINLTTGNLSYWENGSVNSSLSITGLVFSSSERQLTFASSSSWSS